MKSILPTDTLVDQTILLKICITYHKCCQVLNKIRGDRGLEGSEVTWTNLRLNQPLVTQYERCYRDKPESSSCVTWLPSIGLRPWRMASFCICFPSGDCFHLECYLSFFCWLALSYAYVWNTGNSVLWFEWTAPVVRWTLTWNIRAMENINKIRLKCMREKLKKSPGCTYKSRHSPDYLCWLLQMDNTKCLEITRTSGAYDQCNLKFPEGVSPWNGLSKRLFFLLPSHAFTYSHSLRFPTPGLKKQRKNHTMWEWKNVRNVTQSM